MHILISLFSLDFVEAVNYVTNGFGLYEVMGYSVRIFEEKPSKEFDEVIVFEVVIDPSEIWQDLVDDHSVIILFDFLVIRAILVLKVRVHSQMNRHEHLYVFLFSTNTNLAEVLHHHFHCLEFITNTFTRLKLLVKVCYSVAYQRTIVVPKVRINVLIVVHQKPPKLHLNIQ